jgi:hypothetical protein
MAILTNVKTTAKTIWLAASVVLAGILSGCGGGSSTTPVANPSWVATLRTLPATVNLRLSSSLPTYLYVDSGPTNGIYPSIDQFAREFLASNPGFPNGSCSSITNMSANVIDLPYPNGISAPSYVIFFGPIKTGTCTQALNLGAEGQQTFTVNVGP